jgi:GNAT superfamily N-acetyltransferase
MPVYKDHEVVYRFDIADAQVDKQQVLNVCEEAAQNLPYMKIKPDPINIMEAINFFCQCDLRQGAMFLMYADNKVVGFLAATTKNNHPLMLQVPIAHEIVWYVRPEHRGHGGVELINMFEQWAAMTGSRVAVVGHFEDEIGQKLKELYVQMGYKPIEHCYMKEIK